MLTDIFAERYSARVIWDSFTEAESKLLVQCFRIVGEQLIPYWINGKESPTAKAKWKSLHDQLSMELGLHELGPLYYSFQTTYMVQPQTQSGFWTTYDQVCRNFVCAKYTDAVPPDSFIKERISFIELAFRLCEEEIAANNLDFAKRIEAAKLQEHLVVSNPLRLPGNKADGLIAIMESQNSRFKMCVDELNERFKRAGASLNYHNGFIQITSDELVAEQIERTFWQVVADPLWKNVDIDMKEALDRRDANDRDPAFYAARALESAIKIISDQKKLTHGGEKGAHNYIDNIASKKSGSLLSIWESEALKSFFSNIRNPLGHGPGSEKMPQLTLEQTNWAIETCMSWIKSLVQRI